MHFYGLGYQETLNLPLRAFWVMSSNINRISAENDIRNLSVVAGGQGGDGFKEVNRGLQREMGQPIVTTGGVDEEAAQGISKLKALAGKMQRAPKGS